MVLALGASTHHFHARPHLVTLLGMGMTFAALSDFESGRVALRRLFWLVPGFVAWANSHDGVLGGIATVGITVAGWGAAFAVSRGGETIRSVPRVVILFVLVGLCAAATLVNPFGLELPRAWLSLMESSVLPQVMAEHGPLWTSPGRELTLLLGAVYVGAFVSVPWRKWRVTFWVPLVWLFLAWGRVRHAPLFAITAGIALADLLPLVPWMRRLLTEGENGDLRTENRAGRDKSRSRSRTVVGLGLPSAVLAASLIVQSTGWQMPLIGRGWARLDANYWPTELLAELREVEHQRPDGTPIFNDMLFGGFLIYHTPRFRVFIDDRCELYGDAGLLEYATASARHPEQIEEWADKFGFDLALTERDSGFDRYLASAPAWTVARRTAAGTLYRRATIAQP
jgi:hypothetical protein